MHNREEEQRRLFDAAGTARRLRVSPLLAIGPSARRQPPAGHLLALRLGLGRDVPPLRAIYGHSSDGTSPRRQLTVQYALFTAAITTYAVLLADTLGEPALEAAGQRALATAIGTAIAGAAFLIWSNPGEGTGKRRARQIAPPEAAAR